MRWLDLVGGALALSLCVACGGSEFSSSDGAAAGAGGNGGAAGGSSSAGGAGGSGVGGSGGSAGTFPGGNGGGAGASSGGSAGAADCTASGCDAGEYCDADSGRCTSCGNTSKGLRFGPPTRVDGPSVAGVDDRFPRLAADKTLWWSRGDGNGIPNVVSVTPPYTGAATPFRSDASGYIPRGIKAESLEFDAAWDQFENGGRKVYGRTGSSTFALGALNQVVGASETKDFSVAVSENRVWWMTDRVIPGQAEGLHLVTGSPGFAFIIDHVPLVLPDGCHASGPDLAPWTTPQGELLLFAAQEARPNCAAANSGPRDLYWTSLESDGQQAGMARRIAISDAQLDDTDPSLSQDLCTLYFARQEDGGASAHDLWQATRR